MNKLQTVAVCAIIVVAFLAARNYWQGTGPEPSAESPPVIENNNAAGEYVTRMSSYALMPYTTENGHPKTVEKYGARLPEIEVLRKKAAEMALDSGKCDFVEMSELSDMKSTLDHLHFWVDCKNKQRIYLDEFQINIDDKVLTQEEKSWGRNSAFEACREAILERALIPSDVDIHVVSGTAFYKAPISHNVVLHMNFDAKNGFGVSIPYTATCHFLPGEVGTIDIKIRQ